MILTVSITTLDFPAIKIDLKSAELATNSKYFDRVRRALSLECLPRFSILFTWTPPKKQESPVCPSSVAKYFSDLGYGVNLVQTKSRVKSEYSLQIPLLGPQLPSPCEVNGKRGFYATEDEIVEYIGMLALSCSRESQPFMSSWQLQAHTLEVGHAVTWRLEGMFPPETLTQILEALK